MRQAVSLFVPVWVCAACACACACAPGCARDDRATTRSSQTSSQFASAFAGEMQRSPSARPPVVQAMDVYQVTVPLGAVSRSQEFWKHVNEASVDVATYDLLQKNGFRVGVAPASEWAYFRAIVENFPCATRRTTVVGGGEGSIEMPMKTGVESQHLAYLTDDNTLIVRTYERCENSMAVVFQPAPRRSNQVRVTMCPLVRSTRKRIQVTVLNDEREYEYVKPERLYDLNLCADIPLDGFLVVAPSTLAQWSGNLGTTFLVDGGKAEQVEHVLLMVPRSTKVQRVGGLDP